MYPHTIFSPFQGSLYAPLNVGRFVFFGPLRLVPFVSGVLCGRSDPGLARPAGLLDPLQGLLPGFGAGQFTQAIHERGLYQRGRLSSAPSSI